jgi:hypothetical protein
MKRAVLLLTTVAVLVCAAHAKYIADPIVKYKIDARLDAKAKMIKGHEVIVWKNHTSEPVPDLQFHLYWNAFKNNYQTSVKESGGMGRMFGRRETAADAKWGYQQVSSFKVDGQDLTKAMQYYAPDDGNANDQTVLRVVLPKPIAAGQSVTIELDWTGKVPTFRGRTGHLDNYFLMAQWFPKPGVYEAKGERHRPEAGWNCHQFHASTEFFADYGTFDVNLTVPADFEVAASGAERSQKQNPDGTTTTNFYEEDIHDFAWVTQPKSQATKVVRWFKAGEQTSPADIAEWSKKTGASPDDVKLQDVKVTLFLQKEHADQADRHFKAVFAGLKWFGLMYGKYPYDVLTFVDPAKDEGAGMEYPTFFTAGTEYWPPKYALSPEGVIVHEFGHQFWYALVGNNEFEEAWLDEGFNSYSTGKVLEKAYGPNYSYAYISGIPIPAKRWMSVPIPAYPWSGVGRIGLGPYWEYVPSYERYGSVMGYWYNAKSDAMEQISYKTMNGSSYGDQAYSKPEVTLLTLEGLLGDAWPKVIRTYHQRYRFKHPDAIDFMNTVNEVSGRGLKWFFDQTVYGTNTLNYSVSFKNTSVPSREGYWDENGQPKLLKADDKKDGKKEKPATESEVLVRRLGEMEFPVVVRVKLADGSEVRENWDGHYRWTKFKYSGKPKIVLAEIDPDFNWKLEVQRVDDSQVAEPQTKLAAEKWYLRWVVWLQNLLMGFSFFS